MKTLEDEADLQRNKGSNFAIGKIIKGTLNQAQVKMRVSSIPNKFENIVYTSNAHPGFGETTKRFFTPSEGYSFTPGPGQYNPNNKFKVQSKKGSGFFASSTKLHRLQRNRSHVPGPGSYKPNEMQKKSYHKQSRSVKKSISPFLDQKSAAILSAQLQSRNIFKKQIDNSKSKPDVGQYNINPESTKKFAKTHHVFKNNMERFQMEKSQAPPIGLYQPNINILKNRSSSTKKFSTFVHKIQTQAERQTKIQNMIKKMDEKSTKQKVGPGSYDPSLASSSKGFKIINNMYDRFGQLKPIYQMAKTIQVESKKQQYQNQAKLNNNSRNTTHSFFKSKTKKWDITSSNQMDPCIYNSNKSPTKVSHHINFTHKWV